MAEPILASLIHGIASLLTTGVADHGQRLLATGHDVCWLRDELHSMQIFLHEMEACGGDGGAATEAWTHQIRDIMLDSEDVIDVFDASQVSNCSILGNLRAQSKVGARIRRIRNQLSDISRRRLEYPTKPPADCSDNWIHGLGLLASSPLVHDRDTVGLDRDLDKLLQHILGGESELSVMSLVGMGGVGKTTLAKKVYNHPDVKKHFDRSSWVYVSNKTERRGVLREMAKGLMRIPSAEVSSLSEGQLQELLLSGLGGMRFLLVLDDVWEKGFWNVIKLVLPNNGNGSRVLVTTRNIIVAEAIVDVRSDVHRLQPMTFEDSYNLFCKKAFLKDGICPDNLMELINRSMIEVAVASSSGRVKACRVHDLLHDLAISLSIHFLR